MLNELIARSERLPLERRVEAQTFYSRWRVEVNDVDRVRSSNRQL